MTSQNQRFVVKNGADIIVGDSIFVVFYDGRKTHGRTAAEIEQTTNPNMRKMKVIEITEGMPGGEGEKCFVLYLEGGFEAEVFDSYDVVVDTAVRRDEMTEEQKQHYWAMFYCNAYAQIERTQSATPLGEVDIVYLAENSPVKGGAKVADAMLAQMVERWPDKS